MTKHLAHQVAGYDRKTDALAVEYELEPTLFRKIRKLVAADPGDTELAACYPLDGGQLRAISDLTGERFDIDRFEFFLEPS